MSRYTGGRICSSAVSTKIKTKKSPPNNKDDLLTTLAAVSTEDLVTLNKDTFYKVTSSSKPWLVLFSAPWCGPSKKVKPHFQMAATKLKGTVHLGYLDGDLDQNFALCRQYNIKTFPTIVYFPTQGAKPVVYDGAKLADDIVTWAMARFGLKRIKQSG